MPSSVTVKSAAFRPLTGWPSLSRTTVSTCTMRVVTRTTSPGSSGGGEGCCATSAPAKTTSTVICTTNRFIEAGPSTRLQLLLRQMGLGPEFLIHGYGLVCVVGAPFAPVGDAELIISVIGRVQADRACQILNGVFHLPLFQQRLPQFVMSIGMVRLSAQDILQ